MLQLLSATARQLDEAIEANLVAHMSWVQARLRGARVVDTPQIVLVDSGLPCDTFNFVVRARLGDDAAAQIDRVRRFFAETGHPFSWWVGPLDEPRDLGRHLEAAGLVAMEPELGMVCDLSALADVGPLPGELRIARVADARQLADFASVLAANWEPPDAHVTAFYAAAADVLLGGHVLLRLYVAYADEQPVATAEVCMVGGVAGLYGVATAKAWRRRGFGSAVTSAALTAAHDEGARVAVLQSSADGQAMYARLDFRPHGEYVEYQPGPGLFDATLRLPSSS
jgi:GNAT superfamily N-acetyltransferase